MLTPDLHAQNAVLQSILQVQTRLSCKTVYDTSADAVADSYFQLGGNFLTRCTEAPTLRVVR